MENNSKSIYIRVDNRRYITQKDKYKILINKVLKKVVVEENLYGLVILLPNNYVKNKPKMKRRIQAYLKKYKTESIIYSSEIDDDLKWKKGLTNINRKIRNENNVVTDYRICI